MMVQFGDQFGQLRSFGASIGPNLANFDQFGRTWWPTHCQRSAGAISWQLLGTFGDAWATSALVEFAAENCPGARPATVRQLLGNLILSAIIGLSSASQDEDSAPPKERLEVGVSARVCPGGNQMEGGGPADRRRSKWHQGGAVGGLVGAGGRRKGATQRVGATGVGTRPTCSGASRG